MIYELILYTFISPAFLPDEPTFTLHMQAVASAEFQTEAECEEVGREWAAIDLSSRAWKCWGGATKVAGEF